MLAWSFREFAAILLLATVGTPLSAVLGAFAGPAGRARFARLILGALAALVLAAGLRFAADPWADHALDSLVAERQSGATSWAFRFAASCLPRQQVPQGTYRVIHRDYWFGTSEYLIEFSNGKRADIWLQRSSPWRWDCPEAPRTAPAA